MKKGSYADQVNAAKLMLNGVRNQGKTLARRGLDQEFITRLESLHTQAQRLDDEQEGLKSRLQEKTSELDGVLEGLAEKVSEAKKMVKLDFPKESWKEFGITDVR